jgi:hypothetical protein
MNRFIAADRTPGGPKGPEMLARLDPAFDSPMILFQDVIEVLHWSMLAVLLQSTFGFEFHDRRRITGVLVGVDHPRRRMVLTAQGFSLTSLNLGLAWMVFATLFPLGVLQLYHFVSYGYFDARTLQFITSGANPVLEWLRLPGDTLFIIGGVLPILYLSWLSIRHMRPAVKASEEFGEVLFTEVIERPEAH